MIFNFTHFDQYVVILDVVLIWIFLMANEVGYIFMCLDKISISSLVKYLFMVHTNFLIEFFLNNLKFCVLYTFKTQVFIVYVIYK